MNQSTLMRLKTICMNKWRLNGLRPYASQACVPASALHTGSLIPSSVPVLWLLNIHCPLYKEQPFGAFWLFSVATLSALGSRAVLARLHSSRVVMSVSALPAQSASAQYLSPEPELACRGRGTPLRGSSACPPPQTRSPPRSTPARARAALC